MISKSQRTSIKKAKTGIKGPNNTNGYPVVPSEALSVSNNKCTKVQFSANSTKSITLRRGSLLGITRPVWQKVLESELRQKWLEEMIKKDLVVRDIDSYAKSVSTMLRSEELKFQEKEREI